MRVSMEMSLAEDLARGARVLRAWGVARPAGGNKNIDVDRRVSMIRSIVSGLFFVEHSFESDRSFELERSFEMDRILSKFVSFLLG